MKSYEELAPEREETAGFMRRLYSRGLTTCLGGNLSRRVDGGRILITPAALDKGEVTAGQVALMTLEGENRTPHLRASMETGMHLAVFRSRPDVQAVMHAHPAAATAFAAMDMDICCRLTVEACAVVGKVARAEYALMGTDCLAEAVAGALRDADAALMRNHGVVTVGKSLLAAFDRMEVLENAAKMTWMAETLRGGVPLSDERLREIALKFRGAF